MKFSQLSLTFLSNLSSQFVINLNVNVKWKKYKERSNVIEKNVYLKAIY